MNDEPVDEQPNLKQIAQDLFARRIFTSNHVPKDVSLEMIFMPIGFGAFAEYTEERLNDIGMIYEYMSEAGPISCNGLPMFFSLRTLTRKQTEEVAEIYEKIKAAMEAI